MTATRELNIVTKQIILNDKEKMSVRLIPLTADESDINEIQTHINKLESKYEALVKNRVKIKVCDESSYPRIEVLDELCERLTKEKTHE